HFRAFQAPMGMALSGDRLGVGTKIQVWEWVDAPAVTAKLDRPERHDACFLPRSSHVTGHIPIHEMAWGAGGSLRVVNTRFSCLCTRDGSASFTPQWRPPLVSALEPTDRCHLNGLGMVDGRPRSVTALGQTDEPAGWRADKAKGGILIDVASGEVIALLRFETAVQEVFALTVLPGRRYPELINDDEKLLANSFVVPDAALADVSPAVRAPASNGSVPHAALIKVLARLFITRGGREA